MSTKKTTDTTQNSKNTLNYDPASKGMYDKLIAQSGSLLQGWMNNPLGNASYNLGAGAAQRGATAGAQNNMGVLQQMMKTSGMAGRAGNAFGMAQNAKMGRANQSMFAGANMQNIFQALNRQQGATQQSMMFNPLLTGETGNMTGHSEEKTGGLGTWLPQLAGAALGMAGNIATGGMSGAASSLFGGNKVGSTASAFSMPSSAFQPMPNIFAGTGAMPSLASPSYGGSMFPGFH